MDQDAVRQRRLAMFQPTLNGDDVPNGPEQAAAGPESQQLIQPEASTQHSNASGDSAPPTSAPLTSAPMSVALLGTPLISQPTMNFVCIQAEDLFRCIQQFTAQAPAGRTVTRSPSPDLPDVNLRASYQDGSHDATISQECPSPDQRNIHPRDTTPAPSEWEEELMTSRFATGRFGSISTLSTAGSSGSHTRGRASATAAKEEAKRHRSPSPTVTFLDEPSSRRGRLSLPREPGPKASASTSTSLACHDDTDAWEEAKRYRSPSPTNRLKESGWRFSASTSTSSRHGEAGHRSSSPTNLKERSYHSRHERPTSVVSASSNWSSLASTSSGSSSRHCRSPSPTFSLLDRPPVNFRSNSPSKRSESQSAASSRFAELLAAVRRRSPSPPDAFQDEPSTSALRSPTSKSRSRSTLRRLNPVDWSCLNDAVGTSGTTSSQDNSTTRSPSSSPQRQRGVSPDPDFIPKEPPKKRGRPKKAKETGNICAICREPATGKLVNTPCGHFFHEKCLSKWTSTPGQRHRQKKICPNCGLDFDSKLLNPIFL